eukprot:CFRG4023T1
MVKTLSQQVYQAFKRKGLHLHVDASHYLEGSLSEVDLNELSVPLQKIIESVDRDELHSNVVNIDVIKEAVASVLRDLDTTDDDGVVQSLPLEIIDVFAIPKMAYDPDRKGFLETSKNKNLYPDGEAKAAMFKDRYQIIQQRLSRNPHFMKPVIVTADAAGDDATYLQIIPIDSLKSRDTLGSHGVEQENDTVYLLGMLIQYEENRYHLQDMSGHVNVNLDFAQLTTGMFTEQCIVLAEGNYIDSIFHVKVLGLPPSEPSSTTRRIFRDIDLFGGHAHRRELEKLGVREKEMEDTLFVILSDVWLDNLSVLSKLKELFRGYAHAVPDAFVFIGDFCEEPYGKDQAKRVRDGLTTLGEIIHAHQSLIEVPCIFVPSPDDPGPANILPRPPLQASLTAGIRDKLPNCEFVTNPCRIRWYSQEIVIYREDIHSKMQRHCVIPPDTRETDLVHKHLVKTLLDQASLCPLPLSIRPIHWGYDHAMRLYPHPDVLILADKHDQFCIEYEETQCFNPGSFYQSGFSFTAYWPASKTVEPSCLK